MPSGSVNGSASSRAGPSADCRSHGECYLCLKIAVFGRQSTPDSEGKYSLISAGSAMPPACGNSVFNVFGPVVSCPLAVFWPAASGVMEGLRSSRPSFYQWLSFDGGGNPDVFVVSTVLVVSCLAVLCGENQSYKLYRQPSISCGGRPTPVPMPSPPGDCGAAPLNLPDARAVRVGSVPPVQILDQESVAVGVAFQRRSTDAQCCRCLFCGKPVFHRCRAGWGTAFGHVAARCWL